MYIFFLFLFFAYSAWWHQTHMFEILLNLLLKYTLSGGSRAGFIVLVVPIFSFSYLSFLQSFFLLLCIVVYSSVVGKPRGHNFCFHTQIRIPNLPISVNRRQNCGFMPPINWPVGACMLFKICPSVCTSITTFSLPVTCNLSRFNVHILIYMLYVFPALLLDDVNIVYLVIVTLTQWPLNDLDRGMVIRKCGLLVLCFLYYLHAMYFVSLFTSLTYILLL